MKKHIRILPNKKSDCCGCTACINSCPKKCISFVGDDMHFAYPIVDENSCIECGACLRVCPFINCNEKSAPKECYAAINRNEEIRLKSSSGGIFYSLACKTIEEGGVVFGAVFDDDWNVVHKYTDSKDGLTPLMGSKYLQSKIGDSYKEAKEFLNQGRSVLFSGTPCQIAGLKHYLGKDFEWLLTVEVVCHGVPSPAVWHKYLEETFIRPIGKDGKNSVLPFGQKKEAPAIADIKFRDKRKGWKKFGFALHLDSAPGVEKNTVLPSYKPTHTFYEPFPENPFMKVFLRNWSLRPACYNCKAKDGISHADLTIGDFWGIENAGIPIAEEDKGVSCIICRTEKGLRTLLECKDIELQDADYQSILKGNPSIEESVVFNENAKRFQKLFPRKGFYKTIKSIEQPGFAYRLRRHLRWRCSQIFHKLGLDKFVSITH